MDLLWSLAEHVYVCVLTPDVSCRWICVYLDSVSCILSSEDQTSFIWSIVILQATAAATGSSPVCSQTSEDQPGHPLRCHRHPSIRRSTQTVFPQNPTARQWHSQPHFIRSVGPQRASQGLWGTREISNLNRNPPRQIKWSVCGVVFLCFAENSEHSGCWDDAGGCSCSCSGDSFFYIYSTTLSVSPFSDTWSTQCIAESFTHVFSFNQ